MTLGCGGWGGNITSDNISPRHLLNIKRLAYELRPAVTSVTVRSGLSQTNQVRPKPDPTTALPQAPAVPAPAGISAQTLADRIDQFLTSRGYKPPDALPPGGSPGDQPITSKAASPSKPEPAADFVCEDDVRLALRAGRKLVIGEKTIVTPAARDLGEANKVFVQAGWPH
jgi:hypothetical protein